MGDDSFTKSLGDKIPKDNENLVKVDKKNSSDSENKKLTELKKFTE